MGRKKGVKKMIYRINYLNDNGDEDKYIVSAVSEFWARLQFNDDFPDSEIIEIKEITEQEAKEIEDDQY